MKIPLRFALLLTLLSFLPTLKAEMPGTAPNFPGILCDCVCQTNTAETDQNDEILAIYLCPGKWVWDSTAKTWKCPDPRKGYYFVCPIVGDKPDESKWPGICEKQFHD